jgi:hypothetical protein
MRLSCGKKFNLVRINAPGAARIDFAEGLHLKGRSSTVTQTVSVFSREKSALASLMRVRTLSGILCGYPRSLCDFHIEADG